MRSVSRFAALALLLATAVNGCAVTEESTDDEDQGTSEQNLSTCTLGPSCATLNVIGARAFDAPAQNRTRTDVRATAVDTDVVPRILVQKTSRVMKFDGGRATLSGDAAGAAPFFFDDFILVEALALDGKALTVSVVGHGSQIVRVEGKTIAPFTPLPPWIGNNFGYRYEAGVIDLAPVLPRDQPFKLRFTAFDTGGVGLVSDVHLRWSQAGTAPVTTADPFSETFCNERSMTVEERIARFAPAATWANITREPKLAVRSRACHELTGCGAWRAETSFPIGRYESHPRMGAITQWYTFTTPLAPSAIDLQIGPQNELTTWLYLNEGAGGKTMRWHDTSGGRSGLGFDYWEPGELVVDGNARQITQPSGITGIVGKTCTRLTMSAKKDGRVYELVAYAKY